MIFAAQINTQHGVNFVVLSEATPSVIVECSIGQVIWTDVLGWLGTTVAACEIDGILVTLDVRSKDVVTLNNCDNCSLFLE